MFIRFVSRLTLSLGILALPFSSCQSGDSSEKKETTEAVSPENGQINAVPLPSACAKPCMYTDSLVPIDMAAQWTALYRETYPNAPHCFAFHSDDIASLLFGAEDAKGADGLRIYFGSYQNGANAIDEIRPFLVAVYDSNDVEQNEAAGYWTRYTEDYLGEGNPLNGGVTSQSIEPSGCERLFPSDSAAWLASNWREALDAYPFEEKAYTYCVDYICFLIGEAENVASPAIRIYLGLESNADQEEQLKLVLVGVDQEGNDIFSNSLTTTQAVDFSAPCPQFCGDGSIYSGATE